MLRKLLSALSSSFPPDDERAGHLELADLRTDPSTPPVTAELCELRGFRVLVENSRPDIATDIVLARLDEALDLIDRYQPWRLRHLRRDLAQFRVVRFPCRGAFIPEERSCVTELTFLARTDLTAAPVASSIVHEGIHARIHAMGVRAEGRDRAREERLCRRAELEFGLALPRELGAPTGDQRHPLG